MSLDKAIAHGEENRRHKFRMAEVKGEEMSSPF